MRLKERLVRFRSFWIFPLMAVLLIYVTFSAEPRRSYLDLLWLIPAGAFAWTLLEYFLHRFVFHTTVAIRNPHVRDIVNASHLGHHASPRDRAKLLVHPLYGFVISIFLFGILYAVSHSASFAAGMLSGIWAGFLYYEAVHYRVHFNLSGSGLIAWQRRQHFYHHFTNNKVCFGVTSPFWDYVFGTRRDFPEALRREPRSGDIQ